MSYNSGTFDYIYQYKNCLGNVRLSYDKTLVIQEENNYYPFGLKHKGYNNINNLTTGNSAAQKYKYNGKELQDDNIGGSQLNLYDYSARNYDPALGRWMNIDPLAEKSRRFSPYTYVLNNPVYFIDPDGMEEVPYKCHYDPYGQRIGEEQEAPIGNNTEVGTDNSNNIDSSSENYLSDEDALKINSTEDLVEFIKGNKTLNRWYNKFIKKWSKFEVTLADRFTGGPLGKSEGLTNYFTESGYTTVTIYKAALQSPSYLFDTVLHEFGHTNGFYNGFYTSINNKYNSSVANSIDEVYAHRFANQHGGVSINTEYYRSFLKHLKDNNININKIKFPSYE